MLESADKGVGQILNQLDRLQLTRNTLSFLAAADVTPPSSYQPEGIDLLRMLKEGERQDDESVTHIPMLVEFRKLVADWEASVDAGKPVPAQSGAPAPLAAPATPTPAVCNGARP